MVFVKHNSLKSHIYFNPVFIPGFSGSGSRVQGPGPGFRSNPPGIKTSWRRRSDVSLYVSATSQVRLKWNTQWRLDGTSARRPSGTSPWRLIWNVITTSQKDVTTTPHHYVSTTSQTSLKWNTQQRLSDMLPRRLSGTYPRRPISTSLRRLL